MSSNLRPVYTNIQDNRMGLMQDIPLNNGHSSDPYNITGISTTGKIYECRTDEGCYVYRIRFVSLGDYTHPDVAAKLIYVFIRPTTDANIYALYATLSMPGGTIGLSSYTNPELELYFPKGLLLPSNSSINIAASTNYATTERRGDGIYYTVEAGSYYSP